MCTYSELQIVALLKMKPESKKSGLGRDSPAKSIPHSAMSQVYNMLDVGAKYKDLAAALKGRSGGFMFDSTKIRYICNKVFLFGLL